MSGIIDLDSDILYRTIELLQSRLESFSEISFHTGLDIQGLNAFASRAGDNCRLWNVSKVDDLHNWLMVLELACPIQRYGCNYAMHIVGAAACYAVQARLANTTSGIAALAECSAILHRANARVDGLRDTNEWITLQDDDKAEEAQLSYLEEVQTTTRLKGVRRARPSHSPN
jgi:hypothetical protein